MLTEVLKEREAQIELKRLRDASVCGDNQETRAKLREDYEESLRVDREQKQKARDAKIKTVEFQKAQYETLLNTEAVLNRSLPVAFYLTSLLCSDVVLKSNYI